MASAASAWSTADMINAGLLGVAVVAILMTWWQARAGAKTQRAVFLRDLYAEMNNDEGIRAAFYAIEYGRFRYDTEFHGSELEPNMDRLLSFVDVVCELYLRKTITADEMRFFEYRFNRIATNADLQRYLAFLRDFYPVSGAKSDPFPSFAKYTHQFAKRRRRWLRQWWENWVESRKEKQLPIVVPRP